jgi:hypothetical protein
MWFAFYQVQQPVSQNLTAAPKWVPWSASHGSEGGPFSGLRPCSPWRWACADGGARGQAFRGSPALQEPEPQTRRGVLLSEASESLSYGSRNPKSIYALCFYRNSHKIRNAFARSLGKIASGAGGLHGGRFNIQDTLTPTASRFYRFRVQ